MPPVQPMLAKSVKGIPDPAKYGGLSFEPKWDGFRCIVFRDGDEVELASRNTKPLTRYFPEVVAAIKEQLPERCVLDGELFVADRRPAGVRDAPGAHPPGRRPGSNLLAEQTPGRLRGLRPAGPRRRVVRRPSVRRASRGARGGPGGLDGPCYLTRTTEDPAVAEQWFSEFEGAGLDGVVAKPLGAPYQQNARTMLKIKHERTADCVVAGYREHKTSTPERPLLGSLLLGLYTDGELQHIGVSASFTEKRRAELWQELQPLVVPIEDHPWGRWAEFLDRQPGPGAGHAEPLEPGQGPPLHAAAARAGGGGGLRPHGGPPVPAHGAVPALAHRPGPRVVRLRTARGGRLLRSRPYPRSGRTETNHERYLRRGPAGRAGADRGGRPPGALAARGARRPGRLPRAAAARGRRRPHRGLDGLASPAAS